MAQENLGSVADDVSKHSLENRRLEQEIANLAIEHEKSARELQDLRRGYLLRNPSVLTAAISMLGAIAAIAILLSNSYYQVIKERNSLAEDQLKRRESDLKVVEDGSRQRMADAERTRLAAEAVEKASRVRVADANSRQAIAAAKAAEEESLAASSERAAVAAQSKLRTAELALLQEWGVPSFVYDRQGQFQRLAFFGDLPSLAWLRSPVVALVAGIPSGPEPGRSISYSSKGWLRDLPPSVRELSLSASEKGDELDFNELARPEQLTVLRLIVDNEIGTGGRTVLGLGRLRNLEQLEIKGLRQPLQDVERMPHLRKLSVDTNGLEQLPENAIGLVTDLRLDRALTKPVALLPFLSGLRSISLSNNSMQYLDDVARLQTLRTVILDYVGYTEPLPDVLLQMRQVVELRDAALPAGSGVLPWIRKVTLRQVKIANVGRIAKAFPNIDSLGMWIAGDSEHDNTPKIEKALRSISGLKNLSIATQDFPLDTAPISFRNMDQLEELRLGNL